MEGSVDCNVYYLITDNTPVLRRQYLWILDLNALQQIHESRDERHFISFRQVHDSRVHFVVKDMILPGPVVSCVESSKAQMTVEDAGMLSQY